MKNKKEGRTAIYIILTAFVFLFFFQFTGFGGFFLGSLDLNRFELSESEIEELDLSQIARATEDLAIARYFITEFEGEKYVDLVIRNKGGYLKSDFLTVTNGEFTTAIQNEAKSFRMVEGETFTVNLLPLSDDPKYCISSENCIEIDRGFEAIEDVKIELVEASDSGYLTLSWETDLDSEYEVELKRYIYDRYDFEFDMESIVASKELLESWSLLEGAPAEVINLDQKTAVLLPFFDDNKQVLIMRLIDKANNRYTTSNVIVVDEEL